MTQEFSIAARDHGTGIAQERFDGMAGRGCLPFLAVERLDAQESLSDFLLGRAGPVPIESPQHPSQPCPLLPGQARIGRDGTAVQGREEATNGFDPVEAVETERNHGDSDCFAANGTVKDLELLPIAERETEISVSAVHRRVGAPNGRDMAEAVFEQ